MYGRVNFGFPILICRGKRGIGFSLNCAQKLQDGEPLPKPTSASEAFAHQIPGSSKWRNRPYHGLHVKEVDMMPGHKRPAS